MRHFFCYALLVSFLFHIRPPLSLAMVEEEEENVGELVIGVPPPSLTEVAVQEAEQEEERRTQVPPIAKTWKDHGIWPWNWGMWPWNSPAQREIKRVKKTLPDNKYRKTCIANLKTERNIYTARMAGSLIPIGWGVYSFLQDPFTGFPFLMTPAIEVTLSLGESRLEPNILKIASKLSSNQPLSRDEEAELIKKKTIKTEYLINKSQAYSLLIVSGFLAYSVVVDSPYYVGAYSFLIGYNLFYQPLLRYLKFKREQNLKDDLIKLRTQP